MIKNIIAPFLRTSRNFSQKIYPKSFNYMNSLMIKPYSYFGCCKNKSPNNEHSNQDQSQNHNHKHQCQNHNHDANHQCQNHNHKDNHNHNHQCQHHNHDHNHQQHDHGKQHVHDQNCNHNHHQEEVAIPKQCLQIRAQNHKIGDAQIQTAYTKGSLSILDQIQGTKQATNAELYVLMFTCNKCQTRSIRSFTKNAYHKGVVLIRCEGCQNVHLIADHLGWFQDNSTTVQDTNKVHKITDPVAVTKLLKSIFEKNETTQENQQKKND